MKKLITCLIIFLFPFYLFADCFKILENKIIKKGPLKGQQIVLLCWNRLMFLSVDRKWIQLFSVRDNLIVTYGLLVERENWTRNTIAMLCSCDEEEPIKESSPLNILEEERILKQKGK